MKPTNSLIKLLIPRNWSILKNQFKKVLMNYKEYGHFSMDLNSPEYNNKVYSKGKRREPFHYYEIADYLPKDEEFNLCDFGCGQGEGLEFIKKNFPLCKITGIDYSSVAIQKTREKVPEATLWNLDITKSNFPGYFDVILCIETLEHFRNPHKILKILLKHAINRVIISVPFTENKEEIGRVNIFGKHLYNFNEKSFDNIAGCKVLKITDYIETTKERCIIFEFVK